jgi:hypothetical protein
MKPEFGVLPYCCVLGGGSVCRTIFAHQIASLRENRRRNVSQHPEESMDKYTPLNTTVIYTGHFIMFCMITNIYNKKTKGSTLMELFTGTGKLKKFFLTNRDVRCVRHG